MTLLWFPLSFGKPGLFFVNHRPLTIARVLFNRGIEHRVAAFRVGIL